MQNQGTKVLGAVCREICDVPDAKPSIRDYFEEKKLLGMSGVDTRSLTIKTRVHGTMRAALVVGSDDGEYAVQLASKTPTICDMQSRSPKSPARHPTASPGRENGSPSSTSASRTICITSLTRRKGDLYIFPYNATHDEILGCKPDASSSATGPGDPKQATEAIATVKKCSGNCPSSGSAWATRSAALALGGDTYKLKFGHRGANQPVRYYDGRIFITTQNHGFAVDAESLPEGLRRSPYTNVNDGTVEGFENEDLEDHTASSSIPKPTAARMDTESHFFDALFRRIA